MPSRFIDNPLHKELAYPLASPTSKHIDVPDSTRISILQVRVAVEAANGDQALVTIYTEQRFIAVCKSVGSAEILCYQSIKQLKALFPTLLQQWSEIIYRQLFEPDYINALHDFLIAHGSNISWHPSAQSDPKNSTKTLYSTHYSLHNLNSDI
jgi:hypothetical protein